MTRRKLFKYAASGMLAQGLLAHAQQSAAETPKAIDTLPGAEKNRKLKVVLVGAHVDDWIFCVGTLARYAREGHEVLCLSFTPGDSQGMANARHMSLNQLAELRQKDARRGTSLFGARFRILDQNNQKMHVDPEAYIAFNKTLAAEHPDVVFGLWPLQFHPDHRAAGNLAYNSWLQSDMKFDFYFCETWPGSESSQQLFVPNRWVDVDSVINLSREGIMSNTLEAKSLWAEYEMCTKFRGREYGCHNAEAFVRITSVGSVRTPKNPVPGLWYSGVEFAHES